MFDGDQLMFGLDGVIGSKLGITCHDLFSIQPPFQGASLILRQSHNPSSHVLMAPLPTEAAPWVEMNKDKRDSKMGMCSASGMEWSSQNLVK